MSFETGTPSVFSIVLWVLWWKGFMNICNNANLLEIFNFALNFLNFSWIYQFSLKIFNLSLNFIRILKKNERKEYCFSDVTCHNNSMPHLILLIYLQYFETIHIVRKWIWKYSSWSFCSKLHINHIDISI